MTDPKVIHDRATKLLVSYRKAYGSRQATQIPEYQQALKDHAKAHRDAPELLGVNTEDE